MGLTDAERRSYEELGFLVREKAFTPTEVETLREATEALCGDLTRAARNTKVKVSAHYVFELDATDDIVIKWEPGDDEVLQGVEPFAHLHPVFTDYAIASVVRRALQGHPRCRRRRTVHREAQRQAGAPRRELRPPSRPSVLEASGGRT